MVKDKNIRATEGQNGALLELGYIGDDSDFIWMATDRLACLTHREGMAYLTRKEARQIRNWLNKALEDRNDRSEVS